MILIELDPESLLSRLIFGNVFQQLDCGPMSAAKCGQGSATEGMKLKCVRSGSYTPCQSACMTGTTERWLRDDVHDNTRQPTLTARRGATGQQFGGWEFNRVRLGGSLALLS